MRQFLILAAAAAIAPVHFASAQTATGREVVQPLPSPEVQRLNRALLELARRPRSLAALIEAGDASLAVNDYDAALGFYGRAADMDSEDARVKLGLGRVYLRSGRPVEAIPLFNAARSAGAPPRDVLSDQALAFDLVGDQDAAQTAYLRAIELNPSDDEARRRLALSYAISGNEGGFQSVLTPLIEARDVAAFRARAFGLAIMGEQERAEGIVNAVMPTDLAARINPYLAYMPRLTPTQQAAAANLGIFPRAADIGREDPRIARFAREGAAGALLEPAGAPLGEPSALAEAGSASGTETPSAAVTAIVSQEVVQAAPEPPVQVAVAPEPVAPEPEVPAQVAIAAVGAANEIAAATSTETNDIPRPGFDLARSGNSNPAAVLPQIATAQVNTEQATTERADEVPQTAAAPELEPSPERALATAPAPAPTPASVADAFADLGGAEMPTPRTTGQSVDIAALDIPREVAPEPEPAQPAEPVHPRRIWVQLATGRDVDALRFDWRRFNRRAPDLLGEFDPHVTPWGQANRLLAGPVNSRAEARALINGLAAKGIETFAYNSPEGTEIQRLR